MNAVVAFGHGLDVNGVYFLPDTEVSQDVRYPHGAGAGARADFEHRRRLQLPQQHRYQCEIESGLEQRLTFPLQARHRTLAHQHFYRADVGRDSALILLQANVIGNKSALAAHRQESTEPSQLSSRFCFRAARWQLAPDLPAVHCLRVHEPVQEVAEEIIEEGRNAALRTPDAIKQVSLRSDGRIF